ncbi:MAG: hypothetical protein LUE26_05750 [Alistipes sp.]|nr:hypothetical protein [Alistipes sp.]
MSEENKLPEQEHLSETPDNAASGPAKPSPTQVVEEEDDGTKYMSEQEYEQALLNQNLPVGVIAGIVAGIVCAGLWAVVTVATSTIYSFMAILVGLGVGFVIRKAGRGYEKKFGIVGALIALLSCALGNFLATIGFIAADYGAEYFDVLFNFDYSLMPAIMKATFEPIDLLFYVLAVFTGYSASFHNVKVR